MVSLAVKRLVLSGYLGQGGGENRLALFKSCALASERGKGREAEGEGGEKGGRERDTRTERQTDR